MRGLSKHSQIEVAVYKGEDIIASGNINDCAKQLGVQAETLYFYTMPSYQRRLAKRQRPGSGENVRQVVRLDKDDEEDL